MGRRRHHLLLEVAHSKGTRRTTPAGKPRDIQPASLRLNRASRGRMSMGRRPGLASSAAQLVVQHWIDDAVEQLSNMMYTCSLDVPRDYPDGLSESSVAFLLGVTEQAINAETQSALNRFREQLIRVRFDREDL